TSYKVIPSMKNVKLKLIDNRIVREVLTNDEVMATGVSYVDTKSMQEYVVRGKTVVLGASAWESARIMLNSASSAHPGGLGNSSGVVGRYLDDSTGADAWGSLPQLLERLRFAAA